MSQEDLKLFWVYFTLPDYSIGPEVLKSFGCIDSQNEKHVGGNTMKCYSLGPNVIYLILGHTSAANPSEYANVCNSV